MNTKEAKGNWNVQKGKLKQRLALLTDNELLLEEGKKDERIGNLQKKNHKTFQETSKLLKHYNQIIFSKQFLTNSI